jgi:hypothetical protein
VEEIFGAYGIRYERAAVTEGKSKPDFLFPGAGAYRDPEFDAGRLTMLGVKSTCKDRWRQVLAEAKRIETKHLLTLETAISRDQTREMRENCVQLVVPKKLHATYLAGQAAELLNLAEFIGVVRERAA